MLKYLPYMFKTLWRHRIRTMLTVFGTAIDRKSTRLNSSHALISYAVFCLKKKKKQLPTSPTPYSSQ